MAGGINKVILIGNLGVDPEVRYMPSGSAVANIRIATSETWKDKNTGEPQERTEWHRVALFGRVGEVAGQYLRKGSKVYIEGKLRTRKWQGQDGQDRWSTEIVVDMNGTMQMLDSRGAGGGDASYANPGGSQGGPQQGSYGGAQQGNQGGGGPQGGPGEPPGHLDGPPAGAGDFDDDIPF